jgi:hypothetical protein
MTTDYMNIIQDRLCLSFESAKGYVIRYIEGNDHRLRLKADPVRCLTSKSVKELASLKSDSPSRRTERTSGAPPKQQRHQEKQVKKYDLA